LFGIELADEGIEAALLQMVAAQRAGWFLLENASISALRRPSGAASQW
jgi:hypothetical protein